MATEIIMPKLGMGMKVGTVVEWKKNIGDSVQKGDIVVVISSEKIEMEVESPADGVVLDMSAQNGEVVPVGEVIGYIGVEGEKVGSVETPEALFVKGGEQVAASSETAVQVVAPPKKSQVKISPVARKMAEAAGLDIATLVGTGPQGRITKEDVEKAIESAAQTSSTKDGKQAVLTGEQEKPESAAIERTPVGGMRKVIATRMFESLQQSAQLTISMSADVSDLLRLRKQVLSDVQERYEVKLTVTDFIARAVVLALLKHKQMNSAYIEDNIHTYGNVHLGIAVALEKGLVVPVIRNAERCSVIELSQAMKSLSHKARNGQLSAEEMKGSTFTITNLGAYGVELFTPVLNPPEAGILGVGSIQDTPVYIGDSLERRRLLPLSLTFDHRVLDGAPAAEFLATVKRYLEQPHTMLL
ncbi:dihydrolipoamide acetyltransferase family protein [Aneurinibacillus thermoaerophilus]|uniref:Dihydrolipoamide acetyltransferase component of pyruvate dehydrogenase complex n=1 Tax=Aneurinibacillus thermoaerophilus TaxID=143495 RepID=A0A1G7ZUW5_ANETH|nr:MULTISPECIES: dihydrolipoamide acetyltransferase family protein [Aneurinibacillus]AMA72068.1 branched-chain alpha-keto acid dehydrogenase subunit E2 [Aneurinibacillus sp. XH2]MED0676529.1 dihydrolipoamide acetyltransferase family protein [Aneurinibacillus thermoaerophilus]MED0755902.1 dihydrolipoamide acetyltransferase family protein [Aneurinibacillus thermoaerophilus]MED0759774.1 dihydrolipoamide acetyltransferase family protein [Aneurinibacillus thermoaerophilus]QYY42160.1 2-oxo acid dehy